MLFAKRFWAGIEDGTVTVTVRSWKRPQAVAGRHYRTPVGMIQVERVDVVTRDAITDDDAHRAGYESASALLADLRADAGHALYRIEFHRSSEPDPRAELAAAAGLEAADVAAITQRLDRLDRASTHGPWTRGTLALIAERPAVRAADLAASIGRERDAFKLDVRKLKALGLTLSLEVGYRLSPRGEAYLRAVSG